MDTKKDIQYEDVFLTHIELHVKKFRNKSWIHTIMKSIQNKKPGVFHGKPTITKITDNIYTSAMPIPPDTQAQIDRAKKDGKELRFHVPKGGLPIYPGKDMIEFLEAHKKIIHK